MKANQLVLTLLLLLSVTARQLPAQQLSADVRSRLKEVKANAKNGDAEAQWYSLAAAQGYEPAFKFLNIVELHMSPEQIAEAQRLARQFKPRMSGDSTS